MSKELTVKYLNFRSGGLQSWPGSDLHVATWEQTDFSLIDNKILTLNWATGATNSGSLLFLRGEPFPASYSVQMFLSMKRVSHKTPITNTYSHSWAKHYDFSQASVNPWYVLNESFNLERADTNAELYFGASSHYVFPDYIAPVPGTGDLEPYYSMIAFAFKGHHGGQVPSTVWQDDAPSPIPFRNPTL
jgi:hypothetical protein